MASTTDEGFKVLHGLDQVDRPALIKLLEIGFGRPLKNPAALIQSSIVHFYQEANGIYASAALLEETSCGLYLSKFAVAPLHRGDGMAKKLWAAVCAAHSDFFWRCRLTNPFDTWYERQSEGHRTVGYWRVFWHGMASADEEVLVNYCLKREEDFC